MPIVLVHGNPETSAIWDEMRLHLDRTDVVALSPPGFGAPVPENFPATSDAYVDWLALEVQKLDGPVDLVGMRSRHLHRESDVLVGGPVPEQPEILEDDPQPAPQHGFTKVQHRFVWKCRS